MSILVSIFDLFCALRKESDMHLIKQGNIYHFRRNIPSDLVSYFNKNRLVRSIKTSNKKTAITQVALLNTSINQLFFEIRQKRTMGGSDECL